MTKICLFLGVCILFTVATAQQCSTDSINGLFKCKEDAMKAMEESMKTLEPKAALCFTSNGCTMPHFPKGGPHGGGSKHHGGEEDDDSSSEQGGSGSGSGNSTESAGSAEEAATKNQTHQCRKALGKKEHDSTDACVQKATSFNLPKEGPGGMHKGGHGMSGGHGGKSEHGGKDEHAAGDHAAPHRKSRSPQAGAASTLKKRPVAQMDPEKMKAAMEAQAKEFIQKEACVNSTDADAATKVMQCLNDTKNSAMPILQTFCSAKNSCMEKFTAAGCNSSDIKAAFETIKKAKKVCCDAQKNVTIQEKATGVPECASVNLTALAEKEHGDEHDDHKNSEKGKSHGEGPKHQPGSGKPPQKSPPKRKTRNAQKDGEKYGGGPKAAADHAASGHGHDGEEEHEFDMCDVFTGKQMGMHPMMGGHGGPPAPPQKSPIKSHHA